MKVPFLDLHNINKRYDKEFDLFFKQFNKRSWYILGEEVSSFEKEFAAYCGAKYCVGVASGLDALFLILTAYKHLGVLKNGDQVIVSANTYVATIIAIKNAGLEPVLVDADENTFNIDISKINITNQTKAILVTHLYGQLADMDSLDKLCKNNGLKLIADAAQAHGSITYKSKRSGNLCDAAGFSFYPSKNLGALGDGGAITTSDKELYECVFKLRNYGTSSKFINELSGYNSRLDEIQAGFLRIKLKSLDQDNDKRREIANTYLSKINNSHIILPFWDRSKNHVFHLFVIRVKDREHFQNFMTQNQVQTSIHYPIPPYDQKAFSGSLGSFYPVTDRISKEVVSLPISPVMTNDQIQFVIDIVNSYSI